MRPDAFTALHRALKFGPGSCPPDLFAGSVPSIVRGLKLHANNIAHARHVALEESYPRLLQLLGLEAFHDAAEKFLDQPQIADRNLDSLGEGFEQFLDDAAHRNLARAEWAWLQAFHAAEAKALTLSELGTLDPETLIHARFNLHPAVRWFPLEEPYRLPWDHPLPHGGEAVLITRPDADMTLQRIDTRVTSILSLLSVPRTPGELLGTEALDLIALVDAGAVVLEVRP